MILAYSQSKKKACLHEKIICIDLNGLHPHGMLMEQIHFEWELSQSTFGGGLSMSYEWIG